MDIDWTEGGLINTVVEKNDLELDEQEPSDQEENPMETEATFPAALPSLHLAKNKGIVSNLTDEELS